MRNLFSWIFFALIAYTVYAVNNTNNSNFNYAGVGIGAMGTCPAPNVLNWDSTNGYTCNSTARAAYTVATLPTCNSSSKGLMALVTDALLPASLSIVAGGGAVTVGVLCNGTNFIVQ